jgi:hypothetical protein
MRGRRRAFKTRCQVPQRSVQRRRTAVPRLLKALRRRGIHLFLKFYRVKPRCYLNDVLASLSLSSLIIEARIASIWKDAAKDWRRLKASERFCQ